VAATAHPLRRRLLDLIDVHGPAGTPQLAERTGQPAHVLARHLEILRAAGFVEQRGEQSDDGGTGLWRLSSAANRTLTNALPDDPVSKAVVLAAQAVSWDRHGELISQWMTAREGFTDDWRVSAFATDTWLWLSPAELAELREQVCGLLSQWARRPLPEDNVDRRPVLVAAQAVRTEP
jgi:predicted ArsR family transcriptional regulator